MHPAELQEACTASFKLRQEDSLLGLIHHSWPGWLCCPGHCCCLFLLCLALILAAAGRQHACGRRLQDNDRDAASAHVPNVECKCWPLCICLLPSRIAPWLEAACCTNLAPVAVALGPRHHDVHESRAMWQARGELQAASNPTCPPFLLAAGASSSSLSESLGGSMPAVALWPAAAQ